MTQDINPYAPPKAGLVQIDAEAELARRALLRTEANLKAVGLLFIFNGTLFAAAKWMMGHTLFKEFGVSGLSLSSLAMLVPFIAGAGLCALKPWAWIVANGSMALFIVLGLIRFPSGLADVVIHAVVLRFLLGKGPRSVFGMAHQDIIRQTPHIQSRPASWIYKLVATIVALLAFAYIMLRR